MATGQIRVRNLLLPSQQANTSWNNVETTSNFILLKRINVKIWRYVNVEIWRYFNVEIWRCFNVEI